MSQSGILSAISASKILCMDDNCDFVEGSQEILQFASLGPDFYLPNDVGGLEFADGFDVLVNGSVVVPLAV